MSQQTDTTKVHIDSIHSRAICEEVGYRLRRSLKDLPTEPAPKLSQLLKRMRRQELGQEFRDAPSLAPSAADMGAQGGRLAAMRKRFF